jgi:long-chain fatty acid transport protein
MRNLIHSLTLASLLLLAATAARAGGYAIPAENPRELGLSQATVASQTGPEAIYQNSAALAGQQGLSVSAGLETIYNQTTWTGNDVVPGTATLVPKATFPPEIAIAYGGKVAGMNFGLGAGLLVPGGGSIFWPNDWPGSSRIQTVDQRVFLFQVGGAIQPIEALKIGATFLYYGAQEKLTQKLNFLSGPAAQASLGLAGSTPSFGLSAEIRVPGIPLTIGLDYRHSGAMTLTGKVHFQGVPPTYQGLLQDQNVTEAVTVPNEIFAGAAYKVMPNLEIMGSWSLERWTVYTSDTFVGDKGLVITVPRNYKNAYVFRLGAEYSKVPSLPEALTLRVGALRSISPQPTDTISPSLTDGNSSALSIGAGYNITKNLRADVGYQYAFFDTVTAAPNTDAFPGSYATTVHLVSAGVTWRTDL